MYIDTCASQVALVGKHLLASAGDIGNEGLIPGLGRSPAEGHGKPLQYSFLENPHGQRSLVGYSTWGHKESDMTEQLSAAQHRAQYLSLLLAVGVARSSLVRQILCC